MTIVKDTHFGASIGEGSSKCVENMEPFWRCLPVHSKIGLLHNWDKMGSYRPVPNLMSLNKYLKKLSFKMIHQEYYSNGLRP